MTEQHQLTSVKCATEEGFQGPLVELAMEFRRRFRKVYTVLLPNHLYEWLDSQEVRAMAEDLQVQPNPVLDPDSDRDRDFRSLCLPLMLHPDHPDL